MNITNNQRFRSTEEKIKNALLNLLKYRKPNEIYIKEICYEAGINRSSFYAHYQDINDLMIKTEQELANEINKIFQPTTVFMHEHFVKMFEFLQQNKLFYSAYLQMSETSSIEKASFLSYEKPLKNSFNHNLQYNDAEFIYHMTFFGGGIKALSKHWILRGCKETPEQMATIILNEYKNNSKYFKDEKKI